MAALVSICLLAACSKSSDEMEDPNPPPPNPPGNCDTTNRQYAAHVVPILQANCYSCHGTNTNSGSEGIILEGYANIKPRADNGVLLSAINHESGYPAMPKDAAKLSACDINIITSWVRNGAQNN